MPRKLTCNCTLFPILKGEKQCRVCISVERGIPLDDLDEKEFDSFRHRMLKKERLENEKNKQKNKKADEEKRAKNAQQDAMARALRERQVGNYAGPLTACKACGKILSHSERAKYGCYACYRAHMWSLTRTGLPYIPKVEKEFPIMVKGELTGAK